MGFLRRASALVLPPALALAWACAARGGGPEIRLANRSDVALEQVRVRFPSQTEEYGTIPPHSMTAYRPIAKAYSYAYIEATVGGQQAILQPIDFVGETLLGSGRYTYALTFNPKGQAPIERLLFDFVPD